jgi:hypothetical protein
MRRPRYEVDSGFYQVRPILADTSTAMYISIMSHEHDIKGKEFYRQPASEAIRPCVATLHKLVPEATVPGALDFCRS